MRVSSLDNQLYLNLESGTVVIDLLPDITPLHVARVKELSSVGFYDNLIFHRVIEGFMVQTTKPNGTGFIGSGQLLPLEVSEEPFVRGSVVMARGNDLNSAYSQF